MSHSGKRIRKARESVVRTKLYPLDEAVKMVKSGAKTPGRGFVGKVTKAQVREIAEKKIVDLNCDTIESAMKMIEGSARSMGLEVVG